jgi:hypothetical protein
MKNQNPIPLISVMLLLWSVNANAQINPVSGTSAETNGVGFYLSFSKTTFTNGEDIIAWSVLTNSTDSSINVPSSLIGVGLGLTVANANSQPLTPIEPSHGLHVSGPSAALLPAHGCISNYVNISKLYSLNPGSYFVSAKQQLSFHPPWESNVITSPVTKITVENAP